MTPRNERILDRIPKEGRKFYAEMVAADAVREGVDPQAFVDAKTATDRRELMNRQANFDLDHQTVGILKSMMQQAEQADNLRDMGFEPYGSFGD